MLKTLKKEYYWIRNGLYSWKIDLWRNFENQDSGLFSVKSEKYCPTPCSIDIFVPETANLGYKSISYAVLESKMVASIRKSKKYYQIPCNVDMFGSKTASNGWKSMSVVMFVAKMAASDAEKWELMSNIL